MEGLIIVSSEGVAFSTDHACMQLNKCQEVHNIEYVLVSTIVTEIGCCNTWALEHNISSLGFASWFVQTEHFVSALAITVERAFFGLSQMMSWYNRALQVFSP